VFGVPVVVVVEYGISPHEPDETLVPWSASYDVASAPKTVTPTTSSV
jgi:hypothetical protein